MAEELNSFGWTSSGSGGGGGGMAFTSLTYAALQALIGASGLVQGDYYLINDYETIYDQPDYDNAGSPKPVVTTNTGTVEPLIVQASSVNEIYNNAISSIYPLDVIEYDVNFTATEVMNQPTKGRIVLRTDDNNNTTNYDHRQVVFKRYETTPASGNYIVVYDNGNASLDTIPTFGTDCYSNKIGNFYTTLDLSNTGFILSNNIFGNLCHDNTTGADFYNNTFGGNIYSNIFGDLCHDNVIIADAHENIINNDFFLNIIETRFWNNTIGDGFNNNITSPFFRNNEIQTNFQNNILGVQFNSNKIGNNFEYNNTSNYFTSNKIGEYFSINQIGDNFGYDSTNSISLGNTIGDNCYFNFIGDNFYSNFIKNSCIGNTFGATVTFNYTIISGAGYLAGEQITDDPSNLTFATIVSDTGQSMVVKGFTNIWIVGMVIEGLSGGTTASLDSITVFYDPTNISYNNDIGNEFKSNSTEGDFNYNTIGNSFNTNTISTNFQNNNICSNFSANTDIGNNFQFNIFQSPTSSTSYLTATHVYTTYTCIIFTNAAPTQRLSYYDAVDALTITAPNS